ncbi:predicted protein [Micromonas commoda]|uniref:BRX domain-containing protein n=1 Tax=Micromonas commoda (strain RCC299 / NOUM17 / CCMP2709) TaxID=296587 RepID=C1EA07_MICCC|nr:predicted protein [Micromonas commoda]ACO65125.1 predicted protein [Micromonas commoda]|eukprot:XP_002503867.1 predicted protein [Micromonas commoda]
MGTQARGGEAGPSVSTLAEARTALRRGANLLKLCRNAKPHVAYFQLSKDETKLEWVGKGARVKAVRMGLVLQVIAGRETPAFKSSKQPSPPDQCLSLMYREGVGKKPRSLDLVCEDAGQARMWRLGLDAVRERGGAGVTAEAFSSDDEDVVPASSPVRDAKLDEMAADFGVAMKVNSAASKFMKLKSPRGGAEQGDVGRGRRSLRSSAISDPRELFLWGRMPSEFEPPPIDVGDPDAAAGVGPAVGGWREWSVPARAPGADGLDVVAVALGARHAVAVVRHQGVYTWGDGAGGRLGRGVDQRGRGRPSKLSVVSGGEVSDRGAGFERIREVSCGGQYTVAVNYGDGAAYAWGDASGGCHGALGMASPSKGIVAGVSLPTKVSVGFPVGTRVSRVSCGAFHAAAVTAAGDLFCWGEGAFHALGHDGDKSTCQHPRRVRGLWDAGRRVSNVSCGVYHTAAVAIDRTTTGCAGRGELWTWGDADGGKLGHGAEAAKEKAVVAPRRVSGLDENADVTTVSCGQWHTLAACADGVVWVCGSVGKVAPAEPALTPERVPGIPGGAEAIASGEWHAVAIGRGGEKMFSWGRGRRGALGHAGGRDEHAPRAVEALAGRRVHHVACGPESTAAVVSSRSMTVQERAGLTKKKDLALNFGTQPSRGAIEKGLRLTDSGVEADSAPGTPSRGGSRRGPSGGGGAHHHALARVQPGRITAATADGATTAPGNIVGAGRVSHAEPTGNLNDLATRRARAEALSATRERDLLRLEVKALAAKLSRAKAPPQGSEVRSPGRAPVGRSTPAAASRRPASPRPLTPPAARSVPGGLTLERDRALAARETAEAAAALAAEEAANAVAELEAKAAVLEEKVVLAEFELETLRSQVASQTVQSPPPPTRTPLSPVRTRSPTLAAEARAASKGGAQSFLKATAERIDVPSKVSNENAGARARSSAPPALGTRPTSHAVEFRAEKEEPSGDVAYAHQAATPAPSVVVVPTRTPDSAAAATREWVEEVEPGVFLTIATHGSSAAHVLRRVRFSKSKFSDGNAQAWWEQHRARIIRARGLKLVRPARSSS